MNLDPKKTLVLTVKNKPLLPVVGDDDLQISRQSSCPRMSNPQSLTSCACRRPRTCWLPCACETRGD